MALCCILPARRIDLSFGVNKEERCRAGALRGQRSLRDAYTGFAVGLPLVGAKIYASDQWEPHPEGNT